MANRDLIGRMLGEYVLHEPIGQGGGGLVYRSRQPTLNRDLVVKVLHERKHENSSARERFLREAQLASRLQHHYATHIYAFGVEPDGLRWIAMELVNGVTFDVWLREHGPMSLEHFAPLFERIAEVVHAAHQLGIVHRDIKPSNVMVIEDHAGTLVPKLLDFGIAKAGFDVVPGAPERWADGSLAENVAPSERPVPTGEPVTRTDPAAAKSGFTPQGAAMGSAPYMSPEQQGDASSVGPAADIYSLAVLAYQALHGHLPPPPSPRPRADLGAPTVLDRIFSRALARSPADRPATALALAADFRAALEASEREQLRVAVRQWQTGGRTPGLLWGNDMLARFETWTRATSWRALDASELAFISQSQRRGRRSRWSRRLLIGLAAAVVLGTLGGLQAYTSMKARLAQDQVTQLEIEQGRQALQDNAAEAKLHLANAFRRGDHSNGTTFMLARALQPDRAQLALLTGHRGRMWSARFSPTGDTIVTTDDQSAQLWDARTYKLRLEILHPGTVYDAIFSRDGKTLYTTCNNGTVGVWDVATGAALRSFRAQGQSPRYFRLALSPDEHKLAAIDVAGATTSLWSLDSEAMATTVTNKGAGFPAVEFTSDSRWLVTGSGVQVCVFDAQTGKIVIRIPEATRVSVDPARPRFAIGTSDGGVAIWSIPTATMVHQLRAGASPIDRIAFSPDGTQLAAIEGGQVQIWDAGTGKAQQRVFLRSSTAISLELSAKSHLLVSAFSDGSTVIADSSNGLVRSALYGQLRFPHFSADGERVVAATLDDVAKVWSTKTSYLRWSADRKSPGCYYDTPYDQRFISLACPGASTRIWDAQEGRLVAELPTIVDDHSDWVSVLSAVSGTGERAAIVHGRDVELYELPSARLLRTVHHTEDVNIVAFSAERDELISADMAGAIQLTQRDGQSSIWLPRASGGIDALAIFRDRIIVASIDLQLSIYDRNTRDLIARRTTSSRVGKLRISADGSRMVTIPNQMNRPGDPELWDLVLVKRIGTLREPRSTFYSIAFLNKTHQIITTNAADRVVRRWSADTGQLLQSYHGSQSMLVDATVTSDEKTVVALEVEGTLRFWDRDTSRRLWSMPTARAVALAVRRFGGDLITIGVNGEISGWSVPEAASVIKETLDVAVSCGDETQSSDPMPCRSP